MVTFLVCMKLETFVYEYVYSRETYSNCMYLATDPHNTVSLTDHYKCIHAFPTTPKGSTTLPWGFWCRAVVVGERAMYAVMVSTGSYPVSTMELYWQLVMRIACSRY